MTAAVLFALAGAALLCLVGALLYALLRLVFWLSRANAKFRGNARRMVGAGVGVASLLWCGFVLGFYWELQPGDAFYLQEMERVMQQPVPASAKVVAGNASLFRLHGGEPGCSYSRVALSADDYAGLLKETASAPGFETADALRLGMKNDASAAFRVTNVPPMAAFERSGGAASEHFGIVFLEDRVHVEIGACHM
ncbi:MAG: hypothetical protein ACT4NV_17395 [Rhodoferax sp.]